MPAGTIALTNNSAAVTGTGTSFTTELKPNDFIVAVVGGVTYTLGVQSVNSATGVTLITAYNGPTASGVAWIAVPNAALVGITAQVAADVAKAIRGLNLDKANWQQVYSVNGNITVSLPDGSQFSGPSWNSVVNSVSGKMEKNQNLNDLADKSIARTNLGWISGALPVSLGGTGASDAGTARANLLNNAINWELMNTEMRRYAFASGRQNANVQGAGIWTFNNTPFGFNEQYGICMQINNRADASGAAGSGIWQHYLGLGTGGNLLYTTNINGAYRASKLYSTLNTTTNSSGALVPASPIVRIVNNRETASRSDILGVNNEEYTWSTIRGLCNEESKGCTISRVEMGTYMIKGAVGLAKDLWSVMDCGNGQGRIIALAEAKETTDGVIVRCYKQRYTLTDDGELTVGRGLLIDIPDETWIDVRLEMPADSSYNQRQQDVAIQKKALSQPDGSSAS